MIKLVYCICRKQGMTKETFYDYWLCEHGPKVRSVAEAIGAVRYVQSHTCMPEMNKAMQEGRGLAQPLYDGITEVWFRDEEHLLAASQTPAGQEAGKFLVEDESTFIDFSRSQVFMTEEHEIFDSC